MILLVLAASAAAEEVPLPLPRYASTRHGDINVRVGPGKRYPVVWIFTRPNLPIEITQEFENWRKIRDPDGTEGWVTAAALQGRRYVVVQGEMRNVRRAASSDAPIVARAEAGVIGRLVKCPATSPDWCLVELGSTSGWLPRNQFWGVLPDEIYPAP